MFTLPDNTPNGQYDAVMASDKSITVGAGAGTGKTWVLTQRYLRLLMDDDSILPKDILTLTYTEAAAGEMKARITKAIQDSLQDFPSNERKRDILDGLADIWISTIHSFAGRLIRESGLSLDIDPGASVISTRQEQDFWESIRLAAEFANFRELARSYGDKDLRRLAEELDKNPEFSAGVSKWRAEKLAHLARNASELHASSGRDWHEILAWTENDSLIDLARSEVESILADEWLKVWEFWDRFDLPPAKKTNNAGSLLSALLVWKKGANGGIDSLKHFYTGLFDKKIVGNNGEPFKSFKLQNNGQTFGEWREAQPDIYKKITASIDLPLSEHELIMRKLLLKFCALSWGMWDIMKVNRGLLTFSDMINHARKNIHGGGNTRSFRHILVDEYQDTDPLQDAMIKSLVLDNTSLFTVGDPKQSIYGFRYADPALFAQTITEADKSVELDTSFRTKAELLTIINHLFASIWRSGLGNSPAMKGLTYKSLKHLDDGNSRNAGTMPPFTVILAPKSDGLTTEDVRKNLAEELARSIYNWVSEGRTVWDKKDGATRPVRFSDIAILTPARNIYPILEDALERFGIKSIQDKSTDYFARGEINDVVCLLRAAADMSDDFAVAGWLMSPFSGVEEADALGVLTLANSSASVNTLLRTHLPDAYAKLEYLSLIGEHEGPAELVAYFDRNREWLSAYKSADRMRVLRNVRLAVSIARDYQRGGTSSLKSCAQWLTRVVSNGVKFEEPAWHDESENAVRLGTVHSAKGLEYPVTIVFEHRVKKRENSSSLRGSRELGLVFTKLPDEIMDKGEEPVLSRWDKLLSEQGEEEEQTRLFYVAATRAQDSLIFCGLLNKDGNPNAHTWTKLLLNNMIIDDSSRIDAIGIPSHVFPKLEHDEDSQALHEVPTVRSVNPLRQISASSFALYEWCPFAWRRRYRQGIALTWENPQEKAEDYDGYTGGAELGSLAHWILSRWPNGDDYAARLDAYLTDRETLSLLPGSLRDAWRRNYRDKSSRLREWLMRFAESELGEFVRSTPGLEREKSFRLKLNDETILAGAIDAVSGSNIIDYKITSVDKTPPGLYESQLDFYAFALHALTKAESVNTSIAFLREGTVESRTISAFDVIRERVETAARECGCGKYEPELRHCGLCPFKKGCAYYEGV